MKPTIICLVGDSGSGKTLASLYLQEQFDWKAIVSYTTRPMREGETNGVEHWFVDSSRVPESRKMCAYTVFGNHQYWTEWKQFLENNVNVYVIDEKGLINLRSKEQTPLAFNLVTIKINRKDKENIEEERIARDNERVTIPDECYDYVVNNDYSIEAFKATLYLIGKCIERKINYGSTKR